MIFFRSFEKTPNAYDPADFCPTFGQIARRLAYGDFPNFEASPVLFDTLENVGRGRGFELPTN